MKKRIIFLCVILTSLAFVFASCSNNDDAYESYASYGVVTTKGALKLIKLDNDDLVYAKSGLTSYSVDDRVLVHYVIFNQMPVGSDYKYEIDINAIAKVPVHEPVVNVKPIQIDTFGINPFYSLDALWVKDDYLTSVYTIIVSKLGLSKHSFVLLYDKTNQPEHGDTIRLEFRHKVDSDIVQGDAALLQDFVGFKLNSFRTEGRNSVILSIKTKISTYVNEPNDVRYTTANLEYKW